MFIDNEGNVAIAATHNWKFEDTTGYQTCLVKASIDSRLLSIRSTVTASRILTHWERQSRACTQLVHQ